MGKSIREQLEELIDEKYRIFTSALSPGRDNILGVRIPLMRKMAIEIAKGDWRTYLSDARDDTFEEVMLQGMVIGYCKADLEETLKLAEAYIPKINSWSLCDCFCSGLKITEKNRSRVWDFIQPYLTSALEYKIRFGVVMLLGYYVMPEYAPLAFAHFDRIKHEGYYVKMAVAWAISVYFIKLPELTMQYLKKNELDSFTYNKALQKITESFRVDIETKEIIRSRRRK